MTGLFRQGWARVLACTGVALTVAGCDVGSDYQGLAYAFSGSYAAKASGTPVLLKNQAWWESFNDPVLNALIEDGLAGNLNLQVARERVIEAQALVDTVQDVELTDPEVSVEMLLFRLFHERGVRLFEPQPLADNCRCSREKIEGVLSGFSAEEKDEMTVDGQIVVTCEFCNAKYEFDG